MITEFCPNGYADGDGDEYFVLTGSGSLSGWTISDGEGTVSFPSGSSVREQIIVARDGKAYYDIHGSYPDYEIKGTLQSVPDALITGRFQMANTKDDLLLLNNGRVIQTVSWPTDLTSGNGQIHRLTDGVWDVRIVKIGQSDFPPESFLADSVTFFVSPDCSYDSVVSAIRSAQRTLVISMYEFTHPELATEVADVLRRGTSVTLLMEGGPVGGMSGEEKAVLDYLMESGAEVYTIESTDSLPARYRYLHTKYLVADGNITVILSENFKPTGIPLTGSRGNRGWGCSISSAEVAEYYTDVFMADLLGYDIYAYESGNRTLPASWSDNTIDPDFASVTISNVSVTPVLSPDTSTLVVDLIQSATATIDIQQAYISNYPGGAQNVWLENAIIAAGRGVHVRVSLDAMYYNIDGEEDNDEMVAKINRIAMERDLPLEAQLMHPTEEITKLHNKGVIIDGESVLISSINWNYNSPNYNRETGIIIKNQEAAAYFTEVFEYDWNGGFETQPLGPDHGIDVRVFAVVGIIGALVIIWILRRRT